MQCESINYFKDRILLAHSLLTCYFQAFVIASSWRMIFYLLTWCFLMFVIIDSWKIIINLSILDHVVFVIMQYLEGMLFVMFVIMRLLKDDVCAFVSFRLRGIYYSNVLYFKIWSVIVEFIIARLLEGTDVCYCVYHCMSYWTKWCSLLCFVIAFPIEGYHSFLFLFLFASTIRSCLTPWFS